MVPTRRRRTLQRRRQRDAGGRVVEGPARRTRRVAGIHQVDNDVGDKVPHGRALRPRREIGADLGVAPPYAGDGAVQFAVRPSRAPAAAPPRSPQALTIFLSTRLMLSIGPAWNVFVIFR